MRDPPMKGKSLHGAQKEIAQHVHVWDGFTDSAPDEGTVADFLAQDNLPNSCSQYDMCQ